MNYRALADTQDWPRLYGRPEDVYLLRLQLQGARLSSVDDALLVLRAVATSQDYSLDTKAIVVAAQYADPTMVDVVFTADSLTPYVMRESAADVAAKAAAEPRLRARFPNLQFASAQFLKLTGPPDAIDHWRSRGSVYDDDVGPTALFAEQRGVYVGAADDGPRANVWPAAPPPDLNGKKNGAPKQPLVSGTTVKFVALAMAAAFGTWLAAHLTLSREQRP